MQKIPFHGNEGNFWKDDDYYNEVVERNKILEQELINLSGQKQRQKEGRGEHHRVQLLEH